MRGGVQLELHKRTHGPTPFFFLTLLTRLSFNRITADHLMLSNSPVLQSLQPN